jgi:hypothetical protein
MKDRRSKMIRRSRQVLPGPFSEGRNAAKAPRSKPSWTDLVRDISSGRRQRAGRDFQDLCWESQLDNRGPVIKEIEKEQYFNAC